MHSNHARALLRASTIWTIVGLAGGLFYREFTKLHGVPGGTQLALVHTHALTLGTIMLLVVLALAGTYALRLKAFLIVWNAGLALTTVGLLAKGMLQVMGSPIATHPGIAGVSGLGHMTLTAGFVLLLLALRRAISAPLAPAPDRTPAAVDLSH